MARITVGELVTQAKGSPDERKRAFQVYQSWIKNSPMLPDAQRLTQMERVILDQLFAQKGLSSTPTGPQVRQRR